jgi:hypothetical protein
MIAKHTPDLFERDVPETGEHVIGNFGTSVGGAFALPEGREGFDILG